jgi:hypothetical protein
MLKILLIFSLILGILAIIGGSGALFEARSWGEVGRLLPTSSLYKLEVLGSLGEVQKRRNVEEL